MPIYFVIHIMHLKSISMYLNVYSSVNEGEDDRRLSSSEKIPWLKSEKTCPNSIKHKPWLP